MGKTTFRDIQGELGRCRRQAQKMFELWDYSSDYKGLVVAAQSKRLHVFQEPVTAIGVGWSFM